MTTAIEIAKDNGYSTATWEAFTADTALPKGLLERASATKAECEERGETVTHVLYDTDHHDGGWLILGDDLEEMCWTLADGPLEEDDRWSEIERPDASAPSL